VHERLLFLISLTSARRGGVSRRVNILYKKRATGSTTNVTKHFYAGGLQVAKMVGTGVYYLHEDALGSTRLESKPKDSKRNSASQERIPKTLDQEDLDAVDQLGRTVTRTMATLLV
jgi:hypothetical protein